MDTILFVTTNNGKIKEANEYLDDYKVKPKQYDYTEIQSNSVCDIAQLGAKEAFDKFTRPLFVEDSGLFVEALGGFPGPYSAYVETTIGVEKVAKLACGAQNQKAFFKTALVYCSADCTKIFTGEIEGKIVQPRGNNGFAYDPIFEVNGKTLAERTPKQKNHLSHRGRALNKLANWLA